MIKQIIFVILVSLCCSYALLAQSTVERSMTGLQFNLNTVGAYHEIGLSDKATIRLGGDLGLRWRARGTGNTVNFDARLQPALRAEPRYYYNMAKREAKGKRMGNNAGNFVGLKTEYILPVHLFASEGLRNPQGIVSFIPRWGIRRNLGSGWDFELGLGAGVRIEGAGNSMRVYRDLDVEWKFGFRF